MIPKIRTNDREACNEVILGHVRLGMQIVGRYLRQLGNDRLSDELVSAAYEGIVEAVNKVAIGEGMQTHENLTGYIVEWIHQKISTALDNRRVIAVPGRTRRRHMNQGKMDVRPKQIGLSEVDTFREAELPDFEIEEIRSKIIHSDMERKILELRRDGLVDAEIAEELGLAKTSVFIVRKDIEKRFLELMYEQS